jgi:Fur family transcriptional regulator, ferric uptake regulator
MSPSDNIRATLRSAGLRVTLTRVELLRVLLAAPEPLALEDAARLVGQSGGDPATVYRNLQALSEAGVLRSVRGVGRREMFEPATRAADGHAHISCTRCGRVECADALEVPEPPTVEGWQVNDVTVTAWGLCPECANLAPGA